MKRLLCLLLCAATLSWSAVPIFAQEGTEIESTSQTGDGLEANGATDPEPAENPEPTEGDNPSEGSETGDPAPIPKPENPDQEEPEKKEETPAEPDPGVTTPSGVMSSESYTEASVADLSKGGAAFTKTSAVFRDINGKEIKHDTKTLNPKGYRLINQPGVNSAISMEDFPYPIHLDGSTFSSGTFTVNNAKNVNLTVTGTLNMANGAPLTGTVSVSGNLYLPENSNPSGTFHVGGEVQGNKTLTITGIMAANTIAIDGNLILNGSPDATRNYEVLAKSLTVKSGSLSVSNRVMTHTATADGGITVNPGGNLTATAGQIGNFPPAASQVQTGGDLTVNGILNSDGPVSCAKAVNTNYGSNPGPGTIQAKSLTATGAIGIGKNSTVNADLVTSTRSNLQIDGAATVGEVTTPAGNMVINGKLTAQRAIKAAGSLRLQNGTIDGNADISGSSFYYFSGPVKAKNITAINDLSLGDSVTLTGNLSAPGLTVDGNVKAGSVSVSNTIAQSAPALKVNGSLNADTISVTGDVLNTGVLNAAKTLTANKVTHNPNTRSAASLRAGTLTVNQLLAPNSALDLTGAKLNVGTGGITVKGVFRALGGTVNGPMSAQSLIIDGNLNARTIRATNGSATFTGTVTADNVNANAGSVSAKGLTISGALRARDNITLSGPLNAGSVVSDRGNITTSTAAPINQASSVEALKGSVTLGARAAVSGRLYGYQGVTMQDGSAGSIYSEGPVILKGEVSTGNITSKALTIQGKTTAQNVNCTTGNVEAKASLKCNQMKATDRLTVRGSITADSVRGNPVSTPSGGVINAPSINGMENGYKGKLTITTPFGSNRNIYVELRRSGDSANGFNVTTDSNGKVTFTGLASGSYTVYAEYGSNARRGTVSVSSSGTAALDLRSSAGNSSNGQTNGGSNYFDEDEFWEGVYDDIRQARRGDVVRISASKAESVPVWVLKELKGRPITLKLTQGRDSITIDGDNMYDIPNNRVFYKFDDLADIYQYPPDSSSSSQSSQNSQSTPSSSQESSSSQATTATPIVPVPAPVTPPAPPPAPAPLPVTPPATIPPSGESSSEASSSEEESSSKEESSSQEEEESSHPESSEPDEPEDIPAEKEQRTNMFPVVIAVILILVSLGGIAVAYVLYRRSRDNSIYDNDDDD